MRDLIDHIVRRQETEDNIFETLKHVCRGKHMWTVQQNTNKKTGEATKFICVYLMNSYQGEWGYKPVGEEMGPCELTCPVSFFEDVPDPGGHATEWRKRVMERHKRTSKAGLKVGDIVRLAPGCTPSWVVVERLKPFRASGYRVPRRMMAGRWDEVHDYINQAKAMLGFDPWNWRESKVSGYFDKKDPTAEDRRAWQQKVIELKNTMHAYAMSCPVTPPKDVWLQFDESMIAVWKEREASAAKETEETTEGQSDAA